MSSARNTVLEQAGKVIAAWRSERQFIPEQVEDAIIELMRAVEAMNAQAHTRTTDPDTSRQATTGLRMTNGRTLVLNNLRSAQRPLTDHELVHRLQGVMTPSGVRSRRAELVRMGHVCKAPPATRWVKIDGHSIKLPRAQMRWESVVD